MKRILFNATHAEELRVAIVDGQKLIDLDLESAIRSEKKGNVYKAIVTKVEPSLEACFVDYGAEKHGFLPLKEIYRDYFDAYSPGTPVGQIKIDSVIKEGQEMIVQVDKDERGNKGAALTTFVSLAGRFLVLMPNNPKGGGISRRIAGNERAELRDALSALKVDSQHSLIARTEGIGRSQSELQWDLDFLLKLWQTIEQSSSELKAPFLIYQESNLIVRSIRDHLAEEIAEIIVDDEEVYERAQRFINQVMPQNLFKLKLYNDSIPLFARYQIERQIESAFNREVNLPAGGSIAIDHTEALIAIDVNSARATKGSDIEETAFQTNLEAVDEIARQLRVRDMAGLIVIDLIDMTVNRNQRAVEAQLKSALQADRARVQVGHISRFGLLEMSRQRLRSSISDANYRTCPRCEGMGAIRNVVSSSLSLLRIIEDEALKENAEAVQVILPLDMATYLLNEKRHELSQLESRLVSRIIIIPSDDLSSPHFQIKRLRSEEFDELSGIASYKQKVNIDNPEPSALAKTTVNKPEPALVKLDEINHRSPPARKASKKSTNKPTKNTEKVGLLRRISEAVFGNSDTASSAPAERQKTSRQPRKKTQNRSASQSTRGQSGKDRSRVQQNRKRNNNRESGQENQSRQAHAGRDDRTNSGRNQQNKSQSQSRATHSRSGAKSQTRNPSNHNRNNPPATPDNRNYRESNQESARSSQNFPDNHGNAMRSNPQSDQAQSRERWQSTPASNPRSQAPSPRQPSPAPSQGEYQGRRTHQSTNPQRVRPIPTPADDIPDDIGNRKI